MNADSSRPSAFGDHSEAVHSLASLVVSTVTMLTLVVAFGLLALGVEEFWVVFVVGFGGVLPMAVGALATLDRLDDRRAGGESQTHDERTEDESAPRELRRQYARGEFTDEEFERRVERLLETPTTDDSRDPTRRKR
ncbi:Short C-terminal domain-containing protein [Halovenus aranensis]|uniref:Short C-terminal domain-containing protein n=1 Tax=Halovenus aranensis TaxID=890420 RepID=A0A1G8XRQ4_9EURY|nr:SHOCT domain-containing protein [Halovenus aranensis]SDJ93228.1 Short C-terminal domain-containing protein [Halovenus aranensis]